MNQTSQTGATGKTAQAGGARFDKRAYARECYQSGRVFQGRRCACGRPAVMAKGNCPVCERCDALEHAREMWEARRERVGRLKVYQEPYAVRGWWWPDYHQ